MLQQLEAILQAPGEGLQRSSRNDQPEWAAAEYISQFRLRSDEPRNKRRPDATHGDIQVTQVRLDDAEYRYYVICLAEGWQVLVMDLSHGRGKKIMDGTLSTLISEAAA